MTITLNLLVENQPDCGCDTTPDYIDLTPGEHNGVTYDNEDATLTGEADAVWALYRRLAAAVAAGGHGADMTEEDEEELGVPNLTACPAHLCGTGAAESIARIESRRYRNWADYANAAL